MESHLSALLLKLQTTNNEIQIDCDPNLDKFTYNHMNESATLAFTQGKDKYLAQTRSSTTRHSG